MNLEFLSGLAIIMVAGILAQWVAWKFKLPSILLLLLTGLVLGPGINVIDVDSIFGGLLFPVVSLSVAVILFEGGLSLRFSDIRGSGAVVRNLISIGMLVTFGVTTTAGALLLGLDLGIAALLGAILVVTGPTVIIPLLQLIRPKKRVSSILRWEGIVIDPIGAILAVLVFEAIAHGKPNLQIGITQALGTLLQTLLVGGILGLLMAGLLMLVLKQNRMPNTLQNAMSLMFVVGGFTLSNLLMSESGLLTVTIMGIALANQKVVDMSHIMEFKENLQVLLLSGLFIMLAARLDFADLISLGPPVIMFVAVLIFVARPLSVWISTRGTGLKWQEVLFLSWMAPRGIVAAAVASIFALELEEYGSELAGSELLAPLAFVVIISTVVIYSLTAGPLARFLGVAETNPQGIFIVGAHSWARKMALELNKSGNRIMLADSNAVNIDQAKKLGLEAYHCNVLSDSVKEDLDFSGIGSMLAITNNDEVNTLTTQFYRDMFTADNVYQLPRQSDMSHIANSLSGQNVFDSEVTYNYLSMRFNSGSKFISIEIKGNQDFEKLKGHILPLFILKPKKEIVVWTEETHPTIQAKDILIGLVDKSDSAVIEAYLTDPKRVTEDKLTAVTNV